MLITKLKRRRIRKAMGVFMLLTIVNQILTPTIAYALTSGPTAPEATNFEPIDTTDMVNPLTGDFTYNMPLLEVPSPEGGYPLSLSYHAGIQPNEEASWVGLGWSLNPGAISRSVSGYPDDWGNVAATMSNNWDGGTRSTYSIGVSVGISGTASVSAGLAFTQDTYRGFSAQPTMGVGFGLWGVLNANIGISASGDPYAGISYGREKAIPGVSGLMASASLGVQTNFQSISTTLTGSLYGLDSKGNSRNILQASIGTDGLKPSLSVMGTSTTSANDPNKGKISTETNGINLPIPIGPGVFLNLGFSNTRYWSATTQNYSANGVLNNHSSINASSDMDNSDDDNYALLDPIHANIVDQPDPLSVNGGSFPNFDNYSVTAQGLGGSMRPYILSSLLYHQNRINNQDHSKDTHAEKFPINNTPNSIGKKWQFRFINDLSNSYRQNAVWNSDQSFSFDGNPQFGDNDGNLGYDATSNRLEGSKHIEYFTNTEILNGNAASRGFVDCDAKGFTRGLGNLIGGFMITNSSGVTYHYALPAYTSNEHYHTENINQASGAAYSDLDKPASYAYTWYLTAITGADYVSRGTNPGSIDKNDWGYWVKFDYGKWADSYGWRNPSEGFNADMDNGFQNYSSGTKELYYLNAIETRSHTALFVKSARKDAKSVTATGFNSGSVSTLKLDNILLMANNQMTSTVDQICNTYNSGTYANVIDANDISMLSEPLVSKCTRQVGLGFDYSMTPGVPNSLESGNNTNNGNLGKLTLLSVDLRGTGAASVTPPVTFDYDLDPSLSSNQGIIQIYSTTSRSGSIRASASGRFKPGDIIRFQVASVAYYCTLLSTSDGLTFNVLYLSNFPNMNVTDLVARKTKNPPYNKDQVDNWGLFKSDFVASPNKNQNLAQFTTAISNVSTDAWSLRTVHSSLGADIKVEYEGDTYNTSVLNKNRSLIVSGAITRTSANHYAIPLNTESLDLNSVYKIGDKANMILEKYVYSDIPNPTYILQNPFKIINSESYSAPVIEAITGNSISVVVDPRMDLEIISSAGVHYVKSDGSQGETGNGGIFHAVIMRGNVVANGASLFYGGGLRVSRILVDDLDFTDNQIRGTKYDYGVLGFPEGRVNSSGVTTSEPLIFDAIGGGVNILYGANQITDPSYGPLTIYKRELYKNQNYLLGVSRVIPAPGVMYENIAITNFTQLPDGTMISEGKTVHEYEVFKQEMIGIYDNLYLPPVNKNGSVSSSGSGYKLATKSSRDVSIKDYTSRIGNLKRVLTFDRDGHKLTEQVNHYLHDDLSNTSFKNQVDNYEPRLASFGNVPYHQLGVLKERYGTARVYTNSGHVSVSNPSNNQYDELLIMSNQETFPSFLTGSTQIDYKNGTKIEQLNLGYDYYTGKVTTSLIKDSYGNRFMTVTTPARFRPMYAAMGLKTHDDVFFSSPHKHMLDQQSSTYTYAVDGNNTAIGLVSASVQTWAKTSQVLDQDGALTTTGQSNIWRPKATLVWMSDGASANNLTPIASFSDYFSSIPNTNPAWKTTGQFTKFNVYSAALEAADINSNYSASRMGYSNTKVIFSSSPARYDEIAYAGAEDPLLGNGNFSSNVSKGSGTVISDTTNAHTGEKSLNVPASGTGFVYTIPVASITKANYSVAVWVKPTSSNAGQAALYYQIGANPVVTATTTLNKSAAGWYLLEMTIPANAVAGDGNLVVGCKNNSSANLYFDDFRFQPLSSVANAYVYDQRTGELNYMLGNNNIYTRYQYDKAGRLVRIMKEVIGKTNVPLIKAIRYHYGKSGAPIIQ